MLFRWRSYLPIVLVPPALVAAAQSGYVEQRFGHALAQAWMMSCLVVCLLGLALRGLTVASCPARRRDATPASSGRTR